MRLARAEELGEAGLYLLTGLEVVAAGEHAGRRGLVVAVEDGHRGRKRLWLHAVVLRQLFHLLVVKLALVRLAAAIGASDAGVDPLLGFGDELLLEAGAFFGRSLDCGEGLGIVGSDGVLHGGLAFIGELVVDGVANGLGRLFPLLHPLVILFLLSGRGDGVGVVREDSGEAGLQAIEVGLLDVVELVIVAAGAADGEAHEGEAGILGDVVERFLSLLDEVRGVDVFGVEAEQAGGDQGVVVVWLEFVAGELLGARSGRREDRC